MNERQIPIVRPRTPSFDAVAPRIAAALTSGMLTNGRNVAEFEKRVAARMEAEEAVAVSNCTTGLIMTLSVLGLSGEILVPSFTFSATGHACYWAGLKPVFIDCDIRDWTVKLSDCIEQLTPQTCAIMGVHTFGNPADVAALEDFAGEHGLALVFDAAHAIGTEYKGRRVGGAGTASVFSLTPTKVITSGEGGVITTNDTALATELRRFRNYGDNGDNNCVTVGLNGRMSELAAILGLETLPFADDEVAARNRHAEEYERSLRDVPGIIFQHVHEGNRSSYKDMTVLVDEDRFGVDRNRLADALAQRGIATRKYFHHPLHRQSAYADRSYRQSKLTVTDHIAQRTLTLPMHSSLTGDDVNAVCDAIRAAQQTEAPETLVTV